MIFFINKYTLTSNIRINRFAFIALIFELQPFKDINLFSGSFTDLGSAAWRLWYIWSSVPGWSREAYSELHLY